MVLLNPRAREVGASRTCSSVGRFDRGKMRGPAADRLSSQVPARRERGLAGASAGERPAANRCSAPCLTRWRQAWPHCQTRCRCSAQIRSRGPRRRNRCGGPWPDGQGPVSIPDTFRGLSGCAALVPRLGPGHASRRSCVVPCRASGRAHPELDLQLSSDGPGTGAAEDQ